MRECPRRRLRPPGRQTDLRLAPSVQTAPDLSRSRTPLARHARHRSRPRPPRARHSRTAPSMSAKTAPRTSPQLAAPCPAHFSPRQPSPASCRFLSRRPPRRRGVPLGCERRTPEPRPKRRYGVSLSWAPRAVRGARPVYRSRSAGTAARSARTATRSTCPVDELAHSWSPRRGGPGPDRGCVVPG